jgi:inositol transport system ATP-binding protein
MDEVFKISDYVTVFRDGKLIATVPRRADRNKLIALMVGRELTNLFPKEDAEIGEVMLSVRRPHRGPLVEDVSFELRRGEILGWPG